MAGPRAPIGSLSQHSDKAAQLARKPGNAAAARAAAAKNQSNSDDSESDSSSDESDSDSGAVTKPLTDWAANLKSKTPTKSTINGIANSQPTSTQKVVQKSSDSDSESTSETDSDSDAESEKVTTKVGAKVTKAVAKADAESSSEEESSDESEEEAPKPKKTTTAPAKTATALNKFKSAATVTSSDDESSGEESDSGAKVDNKAGESSSEEEDGSDSDSESEDETAKNKAAAAKKAVAKPAVVQKPAAKAKAVEPESESEEGSEADSEESESESDDQSKAVAKRGPKSAEIVAPGFQLRKASSETDATQVAQMFRDAKAEGKQIWYFTAPATLPIEVIQEHALPLEALKTGASIISHDGNDFSGSADTAISNSISVMIPSKAGEQYGSAKIAVDRAIHLKRVLRFNQDGSQDEHTTTTITTSKPSRPQPKGMKIRYQPLGVTNVLPGHMGPGNEAEESDEDVEMAQAPPLSSETPKVGAKKRKHGVVEDGTPGKEVADASSVKKSKKVRLAAEATSGTPASAMSTKHTPVLPPLPVVNGGLSKLKAQPASSPVESKRKKTVKTQDLPSTQPAPATGNGTNPPKKVTPILPPVYPRAGSSKP